MQLSPYQTPEKANEPIIGSVISVGKFCRYRFQRHEHDVEPCHCRWNRFQKRLLRRRKILRSLPCGLCDAVVLAEPRVDCIGRAVDLTDRVVNIDIDLHKLCQIVDKILHHLCIGACAVACLLITLLWAVKRCADLGKRWFCLLLSLRFWHRIIERIANACQPRQTALEPFKRIQQPIQTAFCVCFICGDSDLKNVNISYLTTSFKTKSALTPLRALRHYGTVYEFWVYGLNVILSVSNLFEFNWFYNIIKIWYRIIFFITFIIIKSRNS